MKELIVYECENCLSWYEDKDNIKNCDTCFKEICAKCTDYCIDLCDKCYEEQEDWIDNMKEFEMYDLSNLNLVGRNLFLNDEFICNYQIGKIALKAKIENLINQGKIKLKEE